jgi:hypothetical protein
MIKYIAMYNGRQIEVTADTSYRAHTAAIALFKTPKSKAHMVHVYRVADDIGQSIQHVITN